MKLRTLLLLSILLAAFPPRTAYADSLTLRNVQVVDDHISAEVTVRAMGTAKPYLRLESLGKNLVAEVVRAPQEILLLVDTSGLCTKYQIGSVVQQWTAKLKSELPSSSRMSLAGFHRGSIEIAAIAQPLNAIDPEAIHCDAKAVSSSPDKALRQLLERDPDPGMARSVWILSSGNLFLSKETLEALKQDQTELAIFVYNPFLMNSLKGVLESLSQNLGTNLFSAGTLPTEASDLPIRFYGFEGNLPSGLQGTHSLSAHVKKGDQALKSAPLTFKAGAAKPPSAIATLLSYLLPIAGLVLIAYALYRLVRYFLPRSCRSCGHRIRYRDRSCAFCFSRNGAYLICSNPLGDKQPVVRPLVRAVDEPEIAIGTHRKSRLRCLRARGEKRKAYFTLRRLELDGGLAYRLEATRTPVFVNGVPVYASRHLASGDRICVERSRFTFVLSEGNSNAS